MSDENILVNPDEINKKPERKPRKKEDSTENIPHENRKFENKAGRVTVNFESMGRFMAPPSMEFTDFTVKHVSDLSMVNTENLMETVVAIINEIACIDSHETPVNVGEFTLEEFLEILVGIKAQFNTPHHVHRWLCDCQEDKDQGHVQLSEAIIDLRELKYRSILEVDDIAKKAYEDMFNELSDEEFQKFLKRKYSPEELSSMKKWTREDEVETIKVEEPFNYTHPETGDKYSFRLMRVGDLIFGNKSAKEKFEYKIREIQNQPNPHGQPLAKVKSDRENKIQELKIEQAKYALFNAQAMTLVRFNDMDLMTHEDRLNKYSQLTRGDQFDLSEFLDIIQFGIYDKRELTCNLCGKVEGRLLQQEFTPLALLPLDTDTERRHRKHPANNIYFGV